MSRRQRTILVLLAGLGLVMAGGLAWSLEASDEDTPTSAVTSSERSRGDDSAEISADAVSNNADEAPAAPPDKGGERTRGGGYTCLFTVDNWTPWYIEIFVNGQYNGTVAPWGKWGGWRSEGTMRMFARAPFDDGSFLTWGPADAYCGASFSWRLDP